MNTIGKRMDWARKQKGKSFNDLAKLIGGTNANAVGTAFRRNTIKEYFISVICEKLCINRKWVETGEGDPFFEKLNKLEIKQVAHEEFMEAKYLPLTAQAEYLSYLEGINEVELKKTLVPKEYENGNFVVVEVDGPSMDDGTSRSICDGDKLLIKQLDIDNGEKLPYRNNLFLIVSKEGIVCKQIIDQDLTTGKITCHSFNPIYKDYNINLNDIYTIFQVRKIVERRVKI